MLAALLKIIAPGGHLLLLFFDADSPEQRLVTRLWERVHPFPGTAVTTPGNCCAPPCTMPNSTNEDN